MEFNSLNEVPIPIRHFYYEDKKRDQLYNGDGSPVMLPNDDGIMEPAYINNTYILRVPLIDIKLWEEVYTVIKNARGDNDKFVDYCIGKAIEYDKNLFHDEWIKWNATLESMMTKRDNYVAPDDGYDETDDLYESVNLYNAKEPVETSLMVSDWKLDNAYILRKAMYRLWEDQLDGNYGQTHEEFIAMVNAKYPTREEIV